MSPAGKSPPPSRLAGARIGDQTQMVSDTPEDEHLRGSLRKQLDRGQFLPSQTPARTRTRHISS